MVLNPTCYLAQVPKTNVKTGRTSQRTHIDDENKIANFAMHSTRLDPHLRLASSILKDIYDSILNNKHINDIGLDVGKGLRKNMIVNDMNICIVISYRLNVRGEGNSLRGWSWMDALNRHLKSESRVC